MAPGLGRYRATLGLTFLAAFAAGACGSPDPEKELQKVGSLAAAARLAAEARLTGATTARYTEQLLRAAAQELDQYSQSLRTTELESRMRDEVLGTTSELRQTISAMSVAAEGDGGALAGYLPRLDSLGRNLRALGRSAARR